MQLSINTHLASNKKRGVEKGGKKFSVTYIFRQLHEKILFGMVLITHFSLSELQVHCYKLSPSVKSLFSGAEIYAERRKKHQISLKKLWGES